MKTLSIIIVCTICCLLTILLLAALIAGLTKIICKDEDISFVRLWMKIFKEYLFIGDDD